MWQEIEAQIMVAIHGIILPLAALATLSMVGGRKFTKGKKFFDFTKGLVGDLVVGAGAGAFVNGLDKKFGGGTLASIGIGIPLPGPGSARLDLTDVVVAAGTFGIRLPTRQGAQILAGKKIAEFMGFIDPMEKPADFSRIGQPTTSNTNVGART